MSRTSLLAIVLVCTTIGLASSPAAANTPVRLYVEEQEIRPDEPAYFADWSVMVPLRAVAELLGYSVTYEGANQTITLSTPQETVVLQVGQNAFTRNGEPRTLSKAVELRGARAFVAFGDLQGIAAGIRSTWDAEQQAAHIYRVADYPYPEKVEEAINRLWRLKILHGR